MHTLVYYDKLESIREYRTLKKKRMNQKSEREKGERVKKKNSDDVAGEW